VDNPFGLYVGALWPSFSTGLSPARHGRYSYTQLVPGTYRTRATTRGSLHHPPFWTSLSRAGRRVAVIDVPKAAPVEEPFNGVQIVDWGLHESEIDGGLWTHPRSLEGALRARYGPDPVGRCDLIEGQLEEYERLRQRLLRRVEIKTRMLRDIAGDSSWDLVVAAFGDTHCAGHQLWHLHDDADALAAGRDPARDALRDVYTAADRALGELLASAGSETVTLVLASHGIGPFRGGNKILDDILRHLDPGIATSPGLERRAAAGLRGLWRRGVPVSAKRALIAVRQRTWHLLEGALLRREYAQRRYFAVPNNDAYGALRLNLAGREPHGRVTADEVEQVCGELERELRAVIDLDTGEPAVARVVRARDHYARTPTDNLPDLFVEWNGDRPVVRVRTGGGAVIEGDYPAYRTGDHRPQGAFWLTGAGIGGGAATPISIMDFAPTVGHLLGVELVGLDGRPFEATRGQKTLRARAR
jgi:predicted AlkP superfamily phosphohydrolase/phosphomutase